jgi:hypothetical protein
MNTFERNVVRSRRKLNSKKAETSPECSRTLKSRRPYKANEDLMKLLGETAIFIEPKTVKTFEACQQFSANYDL